MASAYNNIITNKNIHLNLLQHQFHSMTSSNQTIISHEEVVQTHTIRQHHTHTLTHFQSNSYAQERSTY
jgi:hypothetical protein